MIYIIGKYRYWRNQYFMLFSRGLLSQNVAKYRAAILTSSSAIELSDAFGFLPLLPLTAGSIQ